MTYTLLSEDCDTIARLTVQPHNTTLQRFTRDGVQEIDLTDTELRALLAALAPTGLLARTQEETSHGR